MSKYVFCCKILPWSSSMSFSSKFVGIVKNSRSCTMCLFVYNYYGRIVLRRVGNCQTGLINKLEHSKQKPKLGPTIALFVPAFLTATCCGNVPQYTCTV